MSLAQLSHVRLSTMGILEHPTLYQNPRPFLANNGRLEAHLPRPGRCHRDVLKVLGASLGGEALSKVSHGPPAWFVRVLRSGSKELRLQQLGLASFRLGAFLGDLLVGCGCWRILAVLFLHAQHVGDLPSLDAKIIHASRHCSLDEPDSKSNC